MGTMEHLTEETSQIIGCLSGDVVEVDTMSNTMHDGEEQSSECYDLVEGHCSIEGDILVEGSLPEEGDEISGHSQQQDGVGPHHTRRSTTSNCNTVASNTT